MSVTCEACGYELHIGDYPFCPHGRGQHGVQPDDVPGGFWAENGFSEPRQFFSRSAHERALAAEGCEIRAKWAGPEDKHLTRWDTVDLEAAKSLLERGSQARAARRQKALGDAPITRENGGPIRYGDLDA